MKQIKNIKITDGIYIYIYKQTWKYTKHKYTEMHIENTFIYLCENVKEYIKKQKV